jgi:hypothetical protein
MVISQSDRSLQKRIAASEMFESILKTSNDIARNADGIVQSADEVAKSVGSASDEAANIATSGEIIWDATQKGATVLVLPASTALKNARAVKFQTQLVKIYC